MSALDRIMSAIIAILIWLLWKRFQKIQETTKKSDESKGRKKLKKPGELNDTERLFVREIALNYKKATSSSTGSTLPSPSTAVEQSPINAVKKEHSVSVIPQSVPENWNEKAKKMSSGRRSASATRNRANKKQGKSNESGIEWGPFDKQKIPPQKPWVFEGEANYPPNFYAAAHHSRESTG